MSAISIYCFLFSSRCNMFNPDKKYKSRHKDIRKTKESSYLINKSRRAGKKGNWTYF